MTVYRDDDSQYDSRKTISLSQNEVKRVCPINTSKPKFFPESQILEFWSKCWLNWNLEIFLKNNSIWPDRLIFTGPVHGSWSGWTSWSWCSHRCGGGTKTRRRLCDSPAPAHGGADCDGDHYQGSQCNTQPCSVPGMKEEKAVNGWDFLILVHGGWGAWRSSGQCSQSCGGGSQYQSRSCDSPAPARGGNYCQGEHSQYRPCNVKTCK